jgi:hypothetical protein
MDFGRTFAQAGKEIMLIYSRGCKFSYTSFPIQQERRLLAQIIFQVKGQVNPPWDYILHNLISDFGFQNWKPYDLTQMETSTLSS